MSTQMWRVLTPYGTSHDVMVRDDGSSWWARNPGGVIGTAFRGDTPNRAVLRLAERLGWEVTEIRAPGESTTAEQVATLTQERDEARAERRAARLDRDAAEERVAELQRIVGGAR